MADSSSVFCSWDGDAIGRRVGQAVLHDEPEELARLSHAINAGNQVFVSWAVRVRGSLTQCGGDEGCVVVPAEALAELPALMSTYESATGATVSVGVGARLSESAKARLAAKLQGGDQCVIYDAQVEETIKELRPQDERAKLTEAYGDAVVRPSDLASQPQYDPYDDQTNAPRVTKAEAPGTDVLEKMALLDPRAGYRFEVKNATLDGVPHTTVHAYPPHPTYEGEHVGTAEFEHHDDGDHMTPLQVWTHDAHRRQGIASHMYRLAEQHTGKRILPSHNQTGPGQMLWAGSGGVQFGKAEVPPPIDDGTNGGPAVPAPYPGDAVVLAPPAPLPAPAAPLLPTLADAVPQDVASPAPAGPTLQDRVRQAVRAQLEAQRAQLSQDATAAVAVRDRLADIVRGLHGRPDDLRALVQAAPGMADTLADLIGAVRDMARVLPGEARVADDERPPPAVPGIAKGEDLEKTIAALPPGKPAMGGEHDYSHLLPEHLRGRYSLRVRDGSHHVSSYLTDDQGEEVGSVSTLHAPKAKTLEVDAAQLDEQHRGQGLGQAMYEAAYRHGLTRGARQVAGRYHSSDAHHVHEALARKHGLTYAPRAGAPTLGAESGPYRYELKSEDAGTFEQPLGKAAGIGGAQAGREHIIFPVGTIAHGKVKVPTTTGGEAWRQVRAGMVRADDGTPTSSQHPHPQTGQRQIV